MAEEALRDAGDGQRIEEATRDREDHEEPDRGQELSSHHETLKKYQRLYYSQAEQVELDSQGRIRLPERLMAFVGIEQEVALLGVHDHVEIWERSRWNQFLEQYGEAFDTMANEAFGK